MRMICRYIFGDSIRNKVVLIYFLLLAVMAWTSLLMEGSESKGTLTLMSIVLLVVPLMSLLYTTIYLYNARAFIVLLLTQPLRRAKVWHSLYAGLSGSLLLAFVLGAGVPVLFFTRLDVAAVLLLVGSAVVLAFVSQAFLVVALMGDKTRGIGASVLLWLLFSMIYDSVCLYLLFLLEDWPVERLMTGLLMLNPLDLARFQVILRMDASAMMGYSGALFRQFLGDTVGMLVSTALLLFWIVVPYLLSLWLFRKKDL